MKAFHPARIPFPVMHVDTGHNFPEVIDFIRKITGINIVIDQRIQEDVSAVPVTLTVKGTFPDGTLSASADRGQNTGDYDQATIGDEINP